MADAKELRSLLDERRAGAVPSFVPRNELVGQDQRVGFLLDCRPSSAPEPRLEQRVEQIIYIGRESNRLEEIEAGVIHSPETVYTEYPDRRRDELQTKNSAFTEKHPGSGPNEVQWQIPFDAREGVGWAE